MSSHVQLHIPGYEAFLTHFYTDWQNPENAFSNPRSRVVACSVVIENLSLQRRPQEARTIFDECSIKNAWSPDIGTDPFTQDKEKIKVICRNNFNAAQKAVQSSIKH